MNVFLGLMCGLVGLMVMTPRFVDRLRQSEARYGSERQRRAVGSPRRRKQAQVMSVVVGLGFIVAGFGIALQGG